MTGHGIGGGEMISGAGRGPRGDKSGASVRWRRGSSTMPNSGHVGTSSRAPFCLVALSEMKEIDQNLTNFATVERTVDVQDNVSLTCFAIVPERFSIVIDRLID